MDKFTLEDVDIVVRSMQTMAIENGYYTPLSGNACFVLARQLHDFLSSVPSEVACHGCNRMAPIEELEYCGPTGLIGHGFYHPECLKDAWDKA